MSGHIRTKGGHGRLGSVLSGLAVAVGCVLFLGGFIVGALVYQPYTVPTDSMTPTLDVGSRILAERVDGSEVRRGDVVVFRDPLWGDSPMVKRVAAVGGDTVACCDPDGRLTVNGTPVREPYLRPGADGRIRASGTDFSVTVPQGKLFLLGDDRHTSLDSRTHLEEAGQGSVPRGTVLGRVDAVVWPARGLLDRPTGFADLPGGTSEPGPFHLLLTAIAAGALLILLGAAYGPAARLSTRLSGKRPLEPSRTAGRRERVGT
ncbi:MULTISPECIES: signal peptidase I [unclassified Streptomyces]|uniref:signal peptidase I n=1 Tax=unclassified Streptomyces TaxID=2593676 RepID=UPI001660A7AF|nr:MULTISPECIES: signal peptidase I [unclassified Streptomyces]MBD0711317.1 signal peptidase I [Streptomyces sp. CBMA291]MBD0714872.1 signal peptidase I [Streptomyces sp. CBMA370]